MECGWPCGVNEFVLEGGGPAGVVEILLQKLCPFDLSGVEGGLDS